MGGKFSYYIKIWNSPARKLVKYTKENGVKRTKKDIIETQKVYWIMKNQNGTIKNT